MESVHSTIKGVSSNPAHGEVYSIQYYVVKFVNSAFFQLYHGENKLIFNEMTMRSALYQTNKLSWIFIVLVHRNNSPRIEMSPHSNTLS